MVVLWLSMVALMTVVVMVLIFVVVFGDGTRIFGWLLRLFMRCVWVKVLRRANGGV
jgi:hypothetical protein